MLEALRRLEPCVTYIMPYVGIDYSSYSFGKGVRAVLHGSYHSSTACTERGAGLGAFTSRSVLYLARRCKEKGIDIFLSPLPESMRATDGTYSTTADMIGSGVQPIYSLTNEAAYIKLCLAYSLGYEADEIVPFMERNVCGEALI